MTMFIAGYSLCPDVVYFLKKIYEPFLIKYPYIAKHVGYEFKAMSTASHSYTAGAIGIHGQYEGYMDIMYTCA